MNFLNTGLKLTVAGVATAAGMAAMMPATAMAQESAAPTTILAIEGVALSDLLVDEKDAQLEAALELLPDRVRSLLSSPELMMSVGPMGGELGEILAGLMEADSARFALVSSGSAAQFGAAPPSVVLSVGMEQAEADALHERVSGLIEMSSQMGMMMPTQPSTSFDGMTEVMSPVGPVNFGPRAASDGVYYEIVAGMLQDPSAAFTDMPQGEAGESVVVSGKLDFAALSELIGPFLMFGTMGNPAFANQMQTLTEQGFLGEDALSATFTSGYTSTHGFNRIVLEGAKANAEALGIATTSVTAADLSVIPADASYVSVQQFDPAFVWQDFTNQFNATGELDMYLPMVNEFLGIDIEEDLVGTVEGSAIGYISDSTAGGSLLGFVVLQKIKDEAGLTGALETLAGRLNESVAQNLPTTLAGVRVAEVSLGGSQAWQLQTPGLPVPIQPVIAIAGDWAVTAITPGAALAAIEQVGAGDAGILGNKTFADAWEGRSDAVTFSYVDTSRTLKDGYAATTLLTSALNNVVRDPADDAGEIVMITPTVRTLSAGVQPAVMTISWVGDDLEVLTTGDRSALVNIAGTLGIGDAAPLVGGMIIGAGIGSSIAELKNDYGMYDDSWDDDSWDESWDDSSWEDWEEDSGDEYDEDGDDSDTGRRTRETR